LSNQAKGIERCDFSKRQRDFILSIIDLTWDQNIDR